jgi:hypothetical protein
MEAFEVAHIKEQGIDLIIILLNGSFGNKSKSEQETIVSQLQACATSAGLAGIVVPVWDAGGGRMSFLAPPNWHQFFQSINLSFVVKNINRKLTCG